MRLFFIALLFAIYGDAYGQANCQHGDMAGFKENWKSFRKASLTDSPDAIAKFYKFPLELDGPYDTDKPIFISKNIFLKNYRAIFQQQIPGQDMSIFANLKKSTDDISRAVRYFDGEGCAHPGFVILGDYEYQWVNNGWIIKSADYDEYDDLKGFLKSHDVIK